MNVKSIFFSRKEFLKIFVFVGEEKKQMNFSRSLGIRVLKIPFKIFAL